MFLYIYAYKICIYKILRFYICFYIYIFFMFIFYGLYILENKLNGSRLVYILFTALSLAPRQCLTHSRDLIKACQINKLKK